MKHLHDIPPIKHHGTYVYNTVYIYYPPNVFSNVALRGNPNATNGALGAFPIQIPIFLGEIS